MSEGEAPRVSRVYEIASAYIDRVAELDPIAATAMGVPGYDDQLTDYSPEADERRAAVERSALADLESALLEGERDRVAKATMSERLRLHLELHEAGDQFRSLNILASPVQSVRRAFDLMPRETEEQWRNIAARMRAVPQALGSYRRTLETGMERGNVGTRRQAEECAQQATTWSGGGGAPSFFASLVEGFDGAASGGDVLRADLADAARQAAEGYAAFGRFLSERYAPAAEEHDPVGPERYARSARVYNGIELDLEETYTWGWDELHRVERELAETAERIELGAGIEAVKELLETDPERAIDGVEPFREWMQELQDSTIEALDGTHFEIAQPVRRIETLIAPPGGALAMYYTGPSEDFSRPGRTWYPTGGKTRFPL